MRSSVEEKYRAVINVIKQVINKDNTFIALTTIINNQKMDDSTVIKILLDAGIVSKKSQKTWVFHEENVDYEKLNQIYDSYTAEKKPDTPVKRVGESYLERIRMLESKIDEVLNMQSEFIEMLKRNGFN